MNTNTNNAANTAGDNNQYPWYDDRVTELEFVSPAEDDYDEEVLPFCEDVDEDFEDYDEDEDDIDPATSPRDIFDFLDQRVWKQNEAKRAAAMLAYNALVRRIRQNAFFVGPTGCGKTHIWRCLQRLFPDRIVIVDASSLTQDGWKGSTKWQDLLADPVLRYARPSILVLDEADKFLSPKYSSHGENVSQNIAGEGLKIIEGTRLEIGKDKLTYIVDTSRISFVMCGAFSAKADQIAEDNNWKTIGFGDMPVPAKAYDRALTEMDLIDFGVLPELVGRFQRVVNLEPMTEEDYFRMTDSSCGPLERIQRQYKVHISLSETKRRELAAMAAGTGLGIRGMENSIRRLLDDAMFEDCTRDHFEF